MNVPNILKSESCLECSKHFRLLALGSGAGAVEEWEEESGKWIQVFFLNFFCKTVFPAKVKGIRLPWDIKVKPLAMATAEMESSKALNGSRNNTETSLGIQLGTDTVEPESSVQIVSKAALETTLDMLETDTAEMTREVDLKVTSKTFMESSMAVTEEIGVKSSTTNIRPKNDTSTANPHSMEANLKMKIYEKSEEGNFQHSGVSTESPVSTTGFKERHISAPASSQPRTPPTATATA